MTGPAAGGDFDDDGGLDDDIERFVYGGPTVSPWLSADHAEGRRPTAPQRPESLDRAALAAWWCDVVAWVEWMVPTFGVTRYFPDCWARHPALVEELHALWLAWQDAWMPGDDASRPLSFLGQLDHACERVERRWKVPCSPTEHRIPAGGERNNIFDRGWWGNPEYGEIRP